MVEYHEAQFIIGVDLEKRTDAAWPGLDTRAGDLGSVKTLWGPSTPTNRLPLTLYIVTIAGYMFEIRDSGCRLFD